MKQLFFLLIFLIFSNSYSQESWIRIYQSNGWQIKSFYKVHHSDNSNSIFIQHNTNDTLQDPENGAVKKYSVVNNSWSDPANGFLNSKCATCIDPPYVYHRCYPVSFFMISNQNDNFMLNYQITPCATCPDASTYFTYDRGANWNSLYYIFGCGGTLFFPSGGDFDPQNDSVCYYSYPRYLSGYHQPTIYKSTNRGQNWIPTVTIPDLRIVGTPYFGNEFGGGFIKVNPFNTNYIFTVHRDYMMMSTDGGYSFNSINIPPLKELSFDYTDNIIYGVTQNKIYRSSDNGITWDSSGIAFSLNTLEVSPDNSDIIYAGTETGLFRSTNKGITWYAYNNSFSPSKNVIGLSKEINSGDSIIVCTKDAVYKVFKDYIVGIDNANNFIPGSYTLDQNYPNPFNPSTKIKFGLMKSGFTSLKIYDALGRLISQPVNNDLQAGSYEIEFNAAGYASGIYYYKLISGEYTATKKMILAK